MPPLKNELPDLFVVLHVENTYEWMMKDGVQMYQDQVAIKHILEINYSYYYITCSSPKFAVQTNANVCYACNSCVNN